MANKIMLAHIKQMNELTNEIIQLVEPASGIGMRCLRLSGELELLLAAMASPPLRAIMN